MEEYKEKGDAEYIQQAYDQPLQPQQNSEDTTENIDSPSDVRLVTDHTNPMPHLPQQNIGYCPTLENSTPAITKVKWRKTGAARMAGFMFWTNAAGVALLLIGFVSPGWFTIKASQQMHYKTYSSYDDGNTVKYTDVYQDYALWYLTQCKYPDGETTCQTITYRSIDTISDRDCYDRNCNKVVIGSMAFTTEASSLLYFSEAALVFSYSEIVRLQSLYTVGLILALYSLYIWYTFRTGIAKDKITGFGRQKWVYLFILAVLSATLVFVPVVICIAMVGRIGSAYRDDVKTPVGVVFAGFGGGVMVLCSAAVLMHLICCSTEDDLYICTTERGTYGTQITEEEDDV